VFHGPPSLTTDGSPHQLRDESRPL
jgi:hypothetical protein